MIYFYNKKIMKTFYSSLSFILLAINCLFGQYSDIERSEIPEGQVPSAVLVSQQREFNQGFVTGWKIHTKNNALAEDVDYFMATFKNKGRLGNYAYYTVTGELLAYSLFVDARDLPENIQEYCFRNFNNSNIKSAELIDLENPQQFIYRVRLNEDGILNYLYFDNNGNVIDKFKLPLKIFLFI